MKNNQNKFCSKQTEFFFFFIFFIGSEKLYKRAKVFNNFFLLFHVFIFYTQTIRYFINMQLRKH